MWWLWFLRSQFARSALIGSLALDAKSADFLVATCILDPDSTLEPLEWIWESMDILLRLVVVAGALADEFAEPISVFALCSSLVLGVDS